MKTVRISGDAYELLEAMHQKGETVDQVLLNQLLDWLMSELSDARPELLLAIRSKRRSNK